MSDVFKQIEIKQKEYDSFNEHQKDNRARATLLASYAFILAGGSFTASVTLFASRPKDQLTPIIVNFLHLGWFNLFLSMAAFFAMVLIMIIRDYFSAEVNWRPRLKGKEPYLKTSMFNGVIVFFEIAMFATGLFGFSTLIYGLHKIMLAAINLVS